MGAALRAATGLKTRSYTLPHIGRLQAAFSICRTRSSHSRICPILLLVLFTCPLAARRLRAVERSMATRPSLEIRSHLVANFFNRPVSSAADFLSRASSERMLSLVRACLGMEILPSLDFTQGWYIRLLEELPIMRLRRSSL
jgi:hypothetical protein